MPDFTIVEPVNRNRVSAVLDPVDVLTEFYETTRFTETAHRTSESGLSVEQSPPTPDSYRDNTAALSPQSKAPSLFRAPR